MAVDQREPAKIVAGILQTELGLAPGRVMMTYEKVDIPADDALFIAVGYASSKIISVGSVAEATPTGLNEVQEAVVEHLVQIDFMSFSDAARARKEEVALALNSLYAQNQEAAFDIKISQNPLDFVDASELEDTRFLRRFTTTVRVTALVTKTKPAPYYDTFPPVQIVGDPKFAIHP